MLTLSRKLDQDVLIYSPDGTYTVRLKVLELTSTRVLLGFRAPDNVTILRAELVHDANEPSDPQLDKIWSDLETKSFMN